MRKILAFIACSVWVFGLGFTLLPISFSLLTGWLGPVFGTSVHILLAMIFILFGDPLAFPTLIGIWVVTGFVCGLIVRRRLGSIFSASLVFSAMFFVTIIAALRIFEIVEGVGLLGDFAKFLDVIPPPPPGTTLGTIFAAPILNDIYAFLQKMSPESLGAPTDILSPLIGILIFNLAKNLSLIVLSALAGCETGKLAERLLLHKAKLESGVGGNKLDAITSRLRKLLRRQHAASFFLVCALVASTISPAAGDSGNDSYYAEAIFGFAAPDGTAYLASTFIDSDMAFTPIELSAPAFENAVVGILITQDTDAAGLHPILTSPSALGELIPMDIPESFLLELGRYYELVPRTLLLSIYIEDEVNVSRQKADLAASSFSAAFGTSLRYLTSFPQEMKIGGTMYNIVLYIYQSDTPASMVGRNIMDALPVHRNGFAELIGSAYESGIFTPHATTLSANGTIMMAGFFSSSMILNLLETVESEQLDLIRTILPSSETPTPMLGIFSYWANRFHSSSFFHAFNINDLLNNTRPIQFSPDATMSFVLTATSNATIEDGKVTSQQPVVNVITSADLNKPEFKPAMEVIQSLNATASLTVSYAEKGSLILPQDLTVNFVQVMPLNLRVEKLVTFNELDIGQIVEITVRIINNDDTDAAENVTLDDSLLVQYYGSSIEPLEGSLTHTWAQVPKNSSETHTYSIMLKREGIYTLPPAQVTYDYVSNTYSAKSNYIYVKVRPSPLPNLLLSAVPSAWGVLVRTLDRVPSLRGSGFLILSCLTIAILGVLSFNEYRNLRKWIRTRA